MPEWIWPLLSIMGAVGGSLIGSVWRFSRLEADVERMKVDIGTHETGLRGSVHKSATMVTALEMRVAYLERKDGPG